MELDNDSALVVTRSSEGLDLKVTGPSSSNLRMYIRLEGGLPVIELESAAVRCLAATDIDLRCRNFRLQAQEIDLESSGNFHQSIGGMTSVDAADIDLRSRVGNIELKANDDVAVRGEMILLNCDRPTTAAAPSYPPPKPLAAEKCMPTSGDPDIADLLA